MELAAKIDAFQKQNAMRAAAFGVLAVVLVGATIAFVGVFQTKVVEACPPPEGVNECVVGGRTVHTETALVLWIVGGSILLIGAVAGVVLESRRLRRIHAFVAETNHPRLWWASKQAGRVRLAFAIGAVAMIGVAALVVGLGGQGTFIGPIIGMMIMGIGSMPYQHYFGQVRQVEANQLPGE